MFNTSGSKIVTESVTDLTMQLGAQLLPQEPLKGYTYTPFEPMDAALTDLRPILWPK